MTKTSKYLSYILRHAPEDLGVTMDHAGWVEIDELTARMTARGTPLSRDELMDIVADDAKQRYTVSQNGLKIRAAQGHSIEVDLGLMLVTPPERLYHGTADRFLEAIFTQGLQSMNRQFVHLSGDVETARNVGQRHGTPAILEVAAGQMEGEGFAFWRAENGVWLVDQVPIEFLHVLKSNL